MKRQFNVYNYIALILIILTSKTANAQKLLDNGDFESGGSGVGFFVNSAGYSLSTTLGTSVSGNYSFVDDPQKLNSTFNAGVDHTTGTGKMMVVDGSVTPGLNFFWSTKSSTGVGASDIPGFVIGMRYIFSYWIKSISNDVTNVATQANIAFFSPDATSIVPSTLNSLAPLPAQGWQQVSYTFTATDVNVLIQLSNSNTSAIGNDFAIDDMSIVCATPPNLIIKNPATVCSPSMVDLKLAAVTATSDPGTLTYYRDAAATIPLPNPNAVSLANTYYIKNTASLGCETVRPVVVTIDPPVASPSVITPITLCFTAPTALIATPSVGHTLRWYGTAAIGGTASSTPTIPNATGAYYVSQTNGTCESGRVAIQANLVFDNGAKISTLFCSPGQLPVAERNSAVFFEWDNDLLAPNDIYSYSYTIQGSTTVTGTTTSSSLKVSGLLPGQSVKIVITSVKFPCKPTVTETCKVPCPLPLLKPNFPLITQVYCVGNTIPNLSNTSPTTGIVGTWSPSNVISNAASGTYTFTPDPILHPCTETQTLTVTVNPIAAPTFLSLPTPTLKVCQNSTGQVLPTISNDAIPIKGIWGPFTSINTTIIGTTPYTFIPTAGQCVSSTPTTLDVTVNSIETPTFNSIPAFCAGTPSPSFPASTNIPPISGVWNPDKIDNTTTKEYEFTPIITSHPCAPKIKITVTVTQNVTPTFAVLDTQCEGTGIVTLPNTSTNTPIISGTWTDSTGTIISTINTSIVAVNSLFFTPNLGSCVISPTIPKTITVYSNAIPTFNTVPDFCSGTPSPPFPVSNEGITGNWIPNTISNATGTKNYQFTPDINIFPCAPIPPPLSVTVLPSATPNFLPSVPTDVCEGATLPDLPVESNDTPPITGVWSAVTGITNTIDTSIVGTEAYTFTPDAGQCATAPAPIEITVNPSNTLTGVSWTVTDAFTENQIITVVATAPGNYLYQLDSGPLQTSPIFENVSAGTHTITVSDANGCSTSITEPDILVIKHPKYFTPNGDGFNDTWKITGLTSSLITKIYIFDRYGKLLKEIAANGTGWDGTYLGVPLPADDYWFTVDYVEDFSPKEFKAHFTLKR